VGRIRRLNFTTRRFRTLLGGLLDPLGLEGSAPGASLARAPSAPASALPTSGRYLNWRRLTGPGQTGDDQLLKP
jgi:hypothetical protein